MTRLSIKYDAINLGQGMPELPTPPALKEAAMQAIEDDWNQYSITWGSQRLREAIARKTKHFTSLDIDPDNNVTVCCGATEATFASLLAMVNPGEEVILLEPFYESYLPETLMVGARPVFVPLKRPDFELDLDRLRDAFGPKTKAIVINTPANPSGKVFAFRELSAVAELCQQFDVLAIADEVYEHIVYEGHEHVSIATLPGMSDRTITINALSKTYSVTGWRLGYAIASTRLTDAIRKAHDYMTIAAPTPLQEAAVVALNLPDSYYEDLRREYTQRRDLFLEYLEQAGLPYHEPEGAYYVMVDISQLGFETALEAAQRLVKEIGVAGVPGSSFYSRPELGKNFIRFSFAKGIETLRIAGERIAMLRTLP